MPVEFSWELLPEPPPAAPPPVVLGGGATSSSGSADFGIDVSTFPVPDTTFSTISGFRVLAEALSRRLLTRRGSLTYHPDYGMDVRDFINEAMDDGTLGRIKAQVAQELLQDERVAGADATCTFIPSSGRLLINCQVRTAFGPFSFVLSLSAVSVELYLGAS